MNARRGACICKVERVGRPLSFELPGEPSRTKRTLNALQRIYIASETRIALFILVIGGLRKEGSDVIQINHSGLAI